MKQCRFQTSRQNHNLAKRKKWTFLDQMSFLSDYLDVGETSKYIQSDYDDDAIDDSAQECHDTSDENQLAVGQNDTLLMKEESKNINKDNNQSVEIEDTDGAIFLNFEEINPLKGDDTISIDQTMNKTILSSTISNETTHRNDTDNIVMDQNDKFLLSCSPVLKRLANKKNALARLKIQQILFEIEFGEET